MSYFKIHWVFRASDSNFIRHFNRSEKFVAQKVLTETEVLLHVKKAYWQTVSVSEKLIWPTSLNLY